MKFNDPTADGLMVYFGPDAINKFRRELPLSQTEQVAFAYETFGRDGIDILAMVLNKAKP